jgi:hypothetical protein
VGAPRPPQPKRTQPADEVARAQREALKKIEKKLLRRGFTYGRIRALAVAYEERDAGVGLARAINKSFADRVRMLRVLLQEAKRTHVLLHRVFGSKRKTIDLRDTDDPDAPWVPPVPRRPRSPSPPKTGGRMKHLGAFKEDRSCGLSSECHSRVEEVRAHAVLYRRLQREFSNTPLGGASSVLADIEENAPELLSKGAILGFLFGEAKLMPRDVALLFLVRGKHEELPVAEKTLRIFAHKLSQAWSSSRGSSRTGRGS